MFGDFISPRDPRWVRVLERLPHDVYHLPQYVAFAAKHEGGTPAAFYAESNGREILIPVLLRDLPVELGAPREWKDITSPYGYPGPIATHPDDAGWVGESLALFQQMGRRDDIIAAFLRLHPLRGASFRAVAGHGTVVYHGPIVYVDLNRPLDELTAATRENHKRDIKRLEKAGFITRMDDWSLYTAFTSLYRGTMERVEADEIYFFSDQYFQDLRHMHERQLHLCAVLAPNDELAAAGLFTETNGIVEYHLGGSAEPYLRQASSKLMFDATIRWAKGAGAALLNLGGGIGGHPGPLLDFKAGFSSSRAPFHTFRMVFDTGRYSQLTRLWIERSDRTEASDNYFPIYRQPLRSRTPRLSI